MNSPWAAINAATVLISQSRNKEGFESMQRALTQKDIRGLLEERTKRRRETRKEDNLAQLPLDEQPSYISVAVVYLFDIEQSDWSFLNPFVITPSSPPSAENVLAVCAIAAVNMGIAVNREAFAVSNYAHRRQLLQQAKSLYMRAEYLMLDDRPELDSEESLFQIFPTVYTNLIEIDNELGNYDEAKTWFHDLNDCVDAVPGWYNTSIDLHFREACNFYCRSKTAASAA